MKGCRRGYGGCHARAYAGETRGEILTDILRLDIGMNKVTLVVKIFKAE